MKNLDQNPTIWLMVAPVANCWLAYHSDPAIRELFGTDCLPTAFTAQAKPDVVLAEIKRLNPTCNVMLG